MRRADLLSRRPFASPCVHRAVDHERDPQPLRVELADVVQIDVNRQARHIEDEQIERGATLQCEASLEIRMAIEPVEEIEELGDLFEDLDTEPRGRRLPLQPFAREPHDGSSHTWRMTESGTTRFHPATSRPLPASRFSK